MNLPALTNDQCDQLRSLALALPSSYAPATAQEIARHLQFIAATLPSKNVDTETGQRRFAAYVRLLGGYSDKALAYMTERVLRELDWFPTPRQCLAILGDYQHPVTLRELALNKCGWHVQAEYNAFARELRTGKVNQSFIDQQPERFQRMAETQMLLRLVDGGYVQRVQERKTG
jgi:hypothetical protein